MRKHKTPALVNLAIYTTITLFLWIFFDIYRAIRKPPELNIDNKTLAPFNPNLDTNVLEEINNSIYFNEPVVENNISESTSDIQVSTDSGSTGVP